MEIADYESRFYNDIQKSDFLQTAMKLEKEIFSIVDFSNIRKLIKHYQMLQEQAVFMHKQYMKVVVQNKLLEQQIDELISSN